MQAKLDSSDFSTGTIVTNTFTTAATPAAITTVAESAVDHNSAKITVTVSDPNSTTVYLRHKKTLEADSTYSSPTSKTTTTTGASEDVVFELSGLATSTGYTVQAKLGDNDFTSGTIETDDFTTTAPPPAISGIAVPDANRLHNSAKIEISVNNVASGGTTVY